MKTAIIILAAGNSSRLGQPKQLLKYKEETLLSNVINAALATSCRPILIVLGAYKDKILKEHEFADVHYIINEDWQEGISSSISTGIFELLKLEPNIENVIISVSDQAFISARVFQDLENRYNTTAKNIIASSYDQTIGTPVLFNKKYFDQLKALKGNTGAKSIIIQYTEDTATINFESGSVDIDTIEDYNKLINSN